MLGLLVLHLGRRKLTAHLRRFAGSSREHLGTPTVHTPKCLSACQQPVNTNSALRKAAQVPTIRMKVELLRKFGRPMVVELVGTKKCTHMLGW